MRIAFELRIKMAKTPQKPCNRISMNKFSTCVCYIIHTYNKSKHNKFNFYNESVFLI